MAIVRKKERSGLRLFLIYMWGCPRHAGPAEWQTQETGKNVKEMAAARRGSDLTPFPRIKSLLFDVGNAPCEVLKKAVTRCWDRRRGSTLIGPARCGQRVRDHRTVAAVRRTRSAAL